MLLLPLLPLQNFFANVQAIVRANQYDLAVSGQALAEAERALYAKCGTGVCAGEDTKLALIGQFSPLT